MLAPKKITYIGHATILLEIDGVRLLTDPLLRNWVSHLQRRSAAVDPAHYQNLDAVLISHLHWDHLDIPSLRMLGQETNLIVPAGTGSLLRRQGFRNIEEMRPGEATSIGRATIQATHAEHDNHFLFLNPTAGCLGFLIRGSQTIYFAGDTDLFPGMADLAEGLDVALLPVWGWGPSLGKGHMDPYRAAEAVALLRPRAAIPIHWGAFYPRWLSWLRPHLMVEPPQIFRREAKKQIPQVEVHILSPGSSLDLSILSAG